MLKLILQRLAQMLLVMAVVSLVLFAVFDSAKFKKQLAVNELDRIQKDLSAVDPPETLRSQHDLLLQSARLGLMAVRLREEAQSADPGALRNSASAAAGAILTLDRACAAVGCPGLPGR